MADTGVKYPATVSTVLETGDDNDWVNPGNVGADDATYAYIIAASFDSPDTSYLLKATNPSMGVPAGSTINGILVEIERYYANGTVADYDVVLTKDGSARVGDDKSTGATFPTSPAVTSFGGATDLWNTTWTVDEVNATTFGVLYKMQATGANADGYVDFIRVTVYYTASTNRRGLVSWAELETPTAPRRGLISWAELEIPTAPRRGLISWAELEAPNAPRRGQLSWAELEAPSAPRRAYISWAELELPDAGGSEEEYNVARRRGMFIRVRRM